MATGLSIDLANACRRLARANFDSRAWSKSVPPDANTVARATRAHPAGGILGVTSRPAVQARIAAVSADLSLPPAVFVDGMTEALELGIDRAVLLLDLASCCRESELLALVRVWIAFHPGSQVVVFTPLIDREAELPVVVRLVSGVRSATVRVLSASDFFRDETWRNLWHMRERAALQSEIREDLLATFRTLGKPLAAATAVLQILAEAGEGASRYPDDVSSGTTGALGHRTRRRKRVWQRLRDSGHLPPSWLLLLFRLLWYTKLRNDGWPSSRIAHFLGFTSPRHLRLTICRRLGVQLRTLQGLSYEQTLIWTAGLLAGSGETKWDSVRELTQSLISDRNAPPAGRIAPSERLRSE
jgi:hypothetical protein